MPPKENLERDCEECIHYWACSRQCGEPMAQRSANGCECYETVKSIAAARLIERLTAENTALREGASLGKAKRPQKKAYEKSIEFLRALTDGQSDEIKSLRRELEGKDMVIILAQRKQTEAEAERDALQEKQRWIPVTERMPKPETEVLAVCNRNGYIFVIPAIYEDGKLLTQESAWNWSDIYCYGLYDEEVDDYYIPEGWWENWKFNPDDVYNNPVDCAVTHWMPLPGAPEEGEKA